MSWVRIDDSMPDSLKIAPLSDAAFRAYVTSICYCARSLTDGFVPAKKAKEFTGRTRVIQELVPGLWEPQEGGFVVHDYLQYNPTKTAVLAERDKAKARMNAARSPDVRPNIARSSPSPYTSRPDPQTTPPQQQLKRVWTNRIGVLPASFGEEFDEYAERVPEEWFIAAIEKTRTGARQPNWKFCKTILDGAIAENRPPDLPSPPTSKAKAPSATAILDRAKNGVSR